MKVVQAVGIIALCIVGLLFGESIAPMEVLDRIRDL